MSPFLKLVGVVSFGNIATTDRSVGSGENEGVGAPPSFEELSVVHDAREVSQEMGEQSGSRLRIPSQGPCLIIHFSASRATCRKSVVT